MHAPRALLPIKYRTVQAGPVQAPVDDKKKLISPRLPPEQRRRGVLVLYGYKQKAEMVEMHAIFECKELLMAEYVQSHNRKFKMFQYCSSSVH